MVRELNDLNFEKEIAAATKPVLVDFWAVWCGPCRMQAPIIEELDSELSDKVVFAKINVDENLQTANALKIVSIPTLVLYKDGKIAETVVGLTDKAQLSEILIKYI